MATLNDVIEHFGGIPQLADALKIRPQAIYQWQGRIPLLRAFEIERLTGRKFSVDALCRDKDAAA